MNKMVKRWLTTGLSATLLVFLPGCWDYEAINTRSAVIGLGIDPAPDDPKKFEVTIQFPVLGNASASEKGSTPGDTSSYQNLSIEAESLSDAFRNLQRKMDREVDVSELRSIVVSENLSGELMDSAVGQLMRIPRINRLSYLLVTPERAGKILATNVAEAAPMDFVDKTFKVRQQGYVIRRELWQYWRDTTQVGVLPVIPIVKTEQTSKNGGEDTLAFGGVEVYQNSKSLFPLSKHETFYLNLLTGKVREMSFDIPIGDSTIALTDVRAKSRLRCYKQGTSIILVDHVQVNGSLGKINDPSPKPMPPTQVTQLESEVSKYLTEELTTTVQKLQQSKTDVVGFGRYYLQLHPEDEQKLKQSWGDMFAHAKLNITVHVQISSKGVLI